MIPLPRENSLWERQPPHNLACTNATPVKSDRARERERERQCNYEIQEANTQPHHQMLMITVADWRMYQLSYVIISSNNIMSTSSYVNIFINKSTKVYSNTIYIFWKHVFCYSSYHFGHDVNLLQMYCCKAKSTAEIVK